MNSSEQPAGPGTIEPTIMQHTPGPWEWCENALWGAEIEAIHNGRTCLECGHSPTECGHSILGVASEELCWDVCNDGGDWAPNEADRRLIAAAPDLLAALQGLLAAVQRSVCGGSGPAQDAAQAAIGKAIGLE